MSSPADSHHHTTINMRVDDEHAAKLVQALAKIQRGLEHGALAIMITLAVLVLIAGAFFWQVHTRADQQQHSIDALWDVASGASQMAR